nr:ATP synthase F0 subunit B [uncultured Oribacterium sp.]
MLSLKLSSIIFTVINLLVLLYFMHRFLFKPVRAILTARQNELDNSYREAEDANQKANALKKQYEDTMAQVDSERQEKLEKTRLQATQEYDEIIGSAREKASKIIADAKIEAQRQAEQKQHEMEEEVAMLVAKAAYKIAASKDSVENNQKLYDTFLEDAEKNK